jgi:hypothetical protein
MQGLKVAAFVRAADAQRSMLRVKSTLLIATLQ